jgi:CBS domain-containing protein
MELRRILSSETVASLPLREAITVDPTTIARTAVERMRDRQLGCAVIVDPSRRPVGIFTERSVTAALSENVSLDESVVRDLAESRFVAIRRSEPIRQVWDAILKDGFRFVCVTAEDGVLIGLTGQRGLAEYVSEYFPHQVMVQRLGGKPWLQQREGA